MRSVTVSSVPSVEVPLVGALDAGNVAAFRAMADRLLAGAAREVVLRCETLSALDSSGVGAIVFLHRRLAVQGRKLRVAGLSGQPLALARLIRLDAALGLPSSAPTVRRETGLLARLMRVPGTASARPAGA